MKTKEFLRLDFTLEQVREELIRATALHGPMRSSHEGYAVLLEEVDELWDEVKLKKRKLLTDQEKARVRMRKEAIQVAAMAIRFVLDVTYPVADAEPSDKKPKDRIAAEEHANKFL